MRKILIGLSLFVFASTSFASQNKVRLQDGKIVIKTSESTRVLDYDAKDKYVAVNSKKWDVKRETDLVADALQVFEDKSEQVYSQRVLISSKSDGTESVLVEYKSKEDDSKIIISPDDEFMYFVGLTDAGDNVIFGTKLSSGLQFQFDIANDFQVMECPNTSNYYVLLEDDKEKSFIVYDSEGSQDDVLYYTGEIEDLNKVVCY